MYANVMLTLIFASLLYGVVVISQGVKVLKQFNPYHIMQSAAKDVVETATSKYTIKKVENNLMPFVIKVVVVKVASALLIRYIGKKLR